MEFPTDALDTATKVAAGVFGVVVGRYLTIKKERTSLALDFHKELNNTEMSKHRHTAGDFVKEYPLSSIEELEKIDKERNLSVYVVMRFYQRLWMSIKYNQINKSIVSELFAANFYYWYYTFYKHNAVPMGWWSTDQIEDLARWFSKKIPSKKNIELKDKYEEVRKGMVQNYNSSNNIKN